MSTITATSIARRRMSDPSPEERAAEGKDLRCRVPRARHTEGPVPRGRRDPIALLESVRWNRLPSIAPLRYGRMLASPFAFLRGAAVVMAHDLATTPVTGLRVQLCGDAHVANFGGYASPERNLVFDINDFDETLPGPWEWDLKRLVTSVVVLGRDNGLSPDASRAAALACARSYRKHIRAYGEMAYLDVWYTIIDAEKSTAHFDHDPRPMVDAFAKAKRRTNLTTLPQLAERVGGGFRIADDPPLVTHPRDVLLKRLPEVLSAYRPSLPDERRLLLDRYRVVDAARKVVGVGSVGLRCYVALLLGADGDDPLFLQFKEAHASVLAPFVSGSPPAHQGKRVAVGQRIMQAASDLFLGWTRCGRVDYYVRQLRDMKTSVDVERLGTKDLLTYAEVCGWALARAHACSGDAARIGGYLGKSTIFDRAVTAFAEAYADQTERDHALLRAAIKAGRVRADVEA